MGTKTEIQWTEATWNPIRGCTRVSQGCLNCYAERTAMRFAKLPGDPYHGLVKIANGHPQWTGKIRFVEEHLRDPLKWREPKRIFVNSMSDLFHESLSVEHIDQIFAVMACCSRHTFQVLTKRPARMLEYMRQIQDDDKDLHRWQQWACEITDSPCAAGLVEDAGWPPKNIWLGVSCENQPTADERIPLLLQTPAALRWVSAEPLLGPINLTRIRGGDYEWLDALEGRVHEHPGITPGWPHLDWGVVGGESGKNARSMEEEWALSIVRQFGAAGRPVFMKQGSAANWPDFKNFDSFPEELQVREYPEVAR